MADVTVQLNVNGIKRITRGFNRPIKNSRKFFGALALMIDASTQLTFRLLGNRAGHRKWKGYSAGTLKTPAGSWNIRYGTDLSGRPGMQGQPRKGVRRYSSKSQMLQASGGFRQSFKTLSINSKSLKYGTRMKIADQIMSKPPRPVLFVTNQDERNWNKKFLTFYKRGLKF